MDQTTWRAVDDYLTGWLVPEDAALRRALAANIQAGLPPHDVAPNQGKLLHIFARMVRARRILEIGTLGGYSTIWLARALPENGELVTLECAKNHAAIARQNLERAAPAARVTLRVGPALDTLATLDVNDPFDLIFIDADKANNPAYLGWSLTLSHPGTVIIADNVIRDGSILDHASRDERVTGIRHFFSALSANPGLTSTAIQTVGSKGWDGFSISLVN
ncbi:O-methyltransferase [Acerihabitans arboris]|uniref:Methyltransferase n=1 Tax=Acerihabitans arboris TaxID=2691583 RepID=A0A845SDU1_9GAMM|nr:O-methyltransferase [Acerihabitans arboris]NDL62960.1 methyltransferase [Acerihabitans arboris]